MAKIGLSKSAYMQGHQCRLALWFNKHGMHKPAGKESKADSARAASRAAGDEIGLLAHQCFPGGVEINAPFHDVPAGVAATQKLIADGTETIFEATALNTKDGTHARIDVLRKVPGTDEWDMIEVKSGTSPKDKYLDDLAFQYHVFTGAGYKIRSAQLMHVNNKYTRKGAVDPKKLFKISDVTKKILPLQKAISAEVKNLNATVVNAAEPHEDIGQKCSSPNPCQYRGHCWKDVPLYSIFNAFAFQGTAAEDLVKKVGSYDIHDIPEDIAPKGTRSIELRAHLKGEPHVNAEKLAEFLDKVEYPLYYLDYEAVQSAIPLYEGSRPYEQITFQFSLHVQHRPGGPLKHYEFLHEDRTDPREAFAKELVRLCGSKGSVIVYSADFEATRNKELAQAFPEYADKLRAINARMIDLYVPFQQRWLYHPAQNGSASIKAVLPAFSDLSYKGLEISNGEQALNEYLAFVKGLKKEEDLPAFWKALKVYCGQDTMAMVKLMKVIEDAAGREPAPASAKKPLRKPK